MHADPSLRPAWWRRLPVLKTLCRWRWNPHLALAVRNDDGERARRSLAKGANPDLRVPPHDGKVREPLIVFAARQNAVDSIRALVAGGASLEARAADMFENTALATAVLAKQWEAATELALAGADWKCHVWVLDPRSLAAAMARGGIDLSRITSYRSTLLRLATGVDEGLRDTALNFRPLWAVPECRALLARSREGHLDAVLPPADESTAQRRRL